MTRGLPVHPANVLAARRDRLFEEYTSANHRRTSRVFAVLMVGQWLFAILIALLWSPYGWEGKVQSIHVHVYSAVLIGGLLSSLPLALALLRPEAVLTRYVVAVAQMLWSALLIHLTGGRIETHFHVFGSLAFLAFYRDWRVLVPATVVVVGDHLLRGIFWPESVYGIVNPEWWRFLEHGFWVAFEDIVLVLACIRGTKETWLIAGRQAEAELNLEVITELNRTLDARVDERTRQLSLANQQLEETLARNDWMHEQMLRQEKLSSLGVLAAGVAHEINNPMAFVTSNVEVMAAELERLPGNEALLAEYRDDILPATIDGIHRVNRIVADLRKFARGDPEGLGPVDVNAEVSCALRISQNQVKYRCAVETDLGQLPLVTGRSQQLTQVFVNLIVNAAQATREDGRVNVRTYVESEHVVFTVEDNGVGMTREVMGNLFQPFFTTKPVGEGTGLGLSVVHGIVKAHGGRIDVESEPGKGSRFTVRLPRKPVQLPEAERLAG